MFQSARALLLSGLVITAIAWVVSTFCLVAGRSAPTGLMVVGAAFWPTGARPQAQTRQPRFHSEVLSLFQDSRGHYWFGSRSDGLCRFDGEEFTYFREADGIQGDQVSKIQEDANQTLWFKTGGGISSFDGKEWQHHDPGEIAQSLRDKPAPWIKTPGDVWFVADANGAMLRHDGREFSYLSLPTTTDLKALEVDTGPSDYVIFDYFEDRSGGLWISTFRTGVFRLHGEELVHLPGSAFEAPAIRSVLEDSTGTHWLGDNNIGVYQWANGEVTNFTRSYGQSHPDYPGNGRESFDSLGPDFLSRVWAMEQDHRGHIWFGTIGMGVWRYDGDRLKSFPIHKNSEANSVHSIHKDRKGRVWFGTETGEVLALEGGRFASFASLQ